MAALSPGCKPRIPQNYSEIVFLTALDRGTHFSELLRSGNIDLFDPGYFWVLGSGKRCPDPALSLAFFSRESRIPKFCYSRYQISFFS